MDQENSRPYAVVQFPAEKDSLFVVPKCWLTPTDQSDVYKCKWPLKQQTKAAKKRTSPKEEWPSYEAKLIHFSRTYENANAYLEKYKYNTDVETASSGPESASKRIRLTSMLTPSSTLTQSYDQTTSSDNILSKADFNRLEAKVDNLIKHVLEVKADMVSLQEQINSLKVVQRCEGLDMKVDSFKQLQNINEINDFEVKLLNEDEFSKGVKRCGYLGGKDYKEAVRRILQKIFSHETALELTWNTSTNKTSIQKFPNVLMFITVSVRSNAPYKDILQKDVEDVIKRWLRYATDREGGRMERMRKKTV